MFFWRSRFSVKSRGVGAILEIKNSSSSSGEALQEERCQTPLIEDINVKKNSKKLIELRKV
jgi:hypothetical protein